MQIHQVQGRIFQLLRFEYFVQHLDVAQQELRGKSGKPGTKPQIPSQEDFQMSQEGKKTSLAAKKI